VSIALWYILSVVCLGWGLHTLAAALAPDDMPGSRRWWLLRLLPLLACLGTVGETLGRGQINCLVLAALLVAARNVLPALSYVAALDTLYGDFRDDAGLAESCKIARRDGFVGRIAIHPAQVATINECFTPSEVDLAHARRVVAAFAAQPDAFKVLLLECAEEFVHDVPFGVVAEVIDDPGQDESSKDCSDDQVPSAAGGRLVVLLRIHQSHNVLSIIESAGIEKVPARFFTAEHGEVAENLNSISDKEFLG
jgi:hypothetical protein